MTNYQRRNAKKWMKQFEKLTPDEVCALIAFLFALFSYKLQMEERR
jgi:hypothetical protein